MVSSKSILKARLTYIVNDSKCYLIARRKAILPRGEIAFDHQIIKLKKGDHLEFLGRKKFPGFMFDFPNAYYFMLERNGTEYYGEFMPQLNNNNTELYLMLQPSLFLG